MATIKELEASREAIELEIAQAEMPIVDQVIEYLNSEEVMNVLNTLKGLQESLTTESAHAGLQGIITAIEVAHGQLNYRKTVIDIRITNDAAAKEAAATVEAATKA